MFVSVLLALVLAGSASPMGQQNAREEGDRRLARARELIAAGEHAAALDELLWCFDRGHLKDRAFWSKRLGPVLDALSALAADYPPAHEELVRRRDLRTKALLALPAGTPPHNNDVAEVLALNDALHQAEQSVALYDQLVARHPRGDLTFFYTSIRGELWKAKRYRTLVDGRPDAHARLATAASALREASRRLVGQDLQPDPVFVARVVADVALDVEARLALGEHAAADKLADAVVGFAPGLATHALLLAHAERAGGEQLATRLERAATLDLDAGARAAWTDQLAQARLDLQERLGNKVR